MDLVSQYIFGLQIPQVLYLGSVPPTHQPIWWSQLRVEGRVLRATEGSNFSRAHIQYP